MTIYFNASLNAFDEFGQDYKQIVSELEKLGHKVIADHILGYELDKRNHEGPEERNDYYHKMIKNLKKADLMVAEVSYPSTIHVGHELTLALELNKPVLALHKTERLPILFSGIDMYEHFLVTEYDRDSLASILKDSIEYLNNRADTRFNFFISPKHQHYLDWIAKKRRLPRSVFLRNLIKKDIEQNKEYSG